jgi:hypothetical protein
MLIRLEETLGISHRDRGAKVSQKAVSGFIGSLLPKNGAHRVTGSSTRLHTVPESILMISDLGSLAVRYYSMCNIDIPPGNH